MKFASNSGFADWFVNLVTGVFVVFGLVMIVLFPIYAGSYAYESKFFSRFSDDDKQLYGSLFGITLSVIGILMFSILVKYMKGKPTDMHNWNAEVERKKLNKKQDKIARKRNLQK